MDGVTLEMFLKMSAPLGEREKDRLFRGNSFCKCSDA